MEKKHGKQKLFKKINREILKSQMVLRDNSRCSEKFNMGKGNMQWNDYVYY